VLIDIRAPEANKNGILRKFEEMQALELQSCHVCIWDPGIYTAANAEALKNAAVQTGIEISALWAGWSGPAVWNFYDGPLTIGLVPMAYRSMRLKELMAASDFAEKIGVTDMITHVGFLPEDPNDSDYINVISTLRHLALYMKNKGQYFLFECGHETPTTLVRAIEDIGTGNLGINFDTANLILYGKSDSVIAAEIFGKYVRNLHCKDGNYPIDGKNTGNEMPLGKGRANIENVLKVLYSVGYNGPLTIEREISGAEQIRDIIAARDLLLKITN
jgi:sugar phosphate isomerase/epimerase